MVGYYCSGDVGENGVLFYFGWGINCIVVVCFEGLILNWFGIMGGMGCCVECGIWGWERKGKYCFWYFDLLMMFIRFGLIDLCCCCILLGLCLL